MLPMANLTEAILRSRKTEILFDPDYQSLYHLLRFNGARAEGDTVACRNSY